MSAPRRTITVPSRAGAVIVTYRPNDLTLSDYDDAEVDPWGTAVKLIVSSVARWNIGGWNEGRWPITKAAVAYLPEKLVYDIASMIAQDVRVLVIDAMAHTDAA